MQRQARRWAGRRRCSDLAASAVAGIGGLYTRTLARMYKVEQGLGIKVKGLLARLDQVEQFCMR
jgi:hypothetical protein